MMKTRLMLMLACLSCCMASFGQTETTAQSGEKEDSTVNVVGYFCKNDTLTYWINESEWDVANGDTTRINSVSTKVMLTVTDSTKNGYAMEYKFLEFKSAPIDNELSNLTGNLIAKLGDKIKGTVIKFHTDEMGHITKYDNLKEIKKQAKQLFAEAIKEMPLLDSLKSAGLGMKPLLKNVDADALVQGYTEELELLFKLHGNSYDIGERNTHEDATDDAFASDTYIRVDKDSETDDYEIDYDISQYIPAEELSDLMGAVYETFSQEEFTDSMKQDMLKQVNEPLKYTVAYSGTYLWNGWPRQVISQVDRVFKKARRGKLKQTFIEWEDISTGNY